MDMYDSLFSPGSVLNEQVAREIFEIMPVDGPLMVIIGTDGHIWPSDSERFANLNIDEQILKGICERIDDGSEPVLTQVADCSIVATQLATDNTNCGYVVLAVPQYSPESAIANIDLVEMVLRLINLTAKLVEKNNRLYELQLKHFSVYGQGEVAAN